MFSPPDSPAVNDWFRRFDAASRHLPAEERATQREEIQQHLEGLVAAKVTQGQPPEVAWKFALKQFGDPTQIGRKMYREWQQGQTGFRADMKVILFVMGLACLQSLATLACAAVWLLWMHFHGPTHPYGNEAQYPIAGYRIIGFGGTLLICVVTGRKFPLQAIKALLYSSLLWSLVQCLQLATLNMHNKMILSQPLSAMIAHGLLLAPVWALSHSAVAYLASVTKRGWYKPSLADFKLTLPHRRPQISQ